MNSVMSESNHLRSSLLLVLPVIIGLAILIFMSNFLGLAHNEEKLDELALGKETKIYRATYQGFPVHCNEISDGKICLEGWKKRGSRPVTLWLGNSQLHAINQMKAHDVNGVQVLFEKLASIGNELLTFSEPNASLLEHYLLYLYLRNHVPVQTLILPVVFDDMRENGVRAGLTPALNDRIVNQELSKTVIGREILAEKKSLKSDDDLAGLNDTPQKNIEEWIVSLLTERWALWAARPKMRGQLLKNLYLWRNSAFGINAQSKRKIIPGRYKKNMEALGEILRFCAIDKTNVIIYIVPLRNDVAPPYVLKEYMRFKNEIRLLAAQHAAVFVNLEGLVPGRLWGKKDATSSNGVAELDFMHFQVGGHRLLAQALFDLLKSNNFLSSNK